MGDNIRMVPEFLKQKRRWINRAFGAVRRRFSPIDWSDEANYAQNVKRSFKDCFGYDLPLDNPRTFAEKMQWLKIYNNDPIKTRLADKYLVREWVKEKIGDEYLIPLLGVYDRFDDIDFNGLPDQFVIKCNHGCGYNIIVTDKNKIDISTAKRTINGWLSENYGHKFGENQYSNIKPKIIIESFIGGGRQLLDYRYYCFGGKPCYIHFDYQGHFYVDVKGSSNINSFYDVDWNNQKFDYRNKLCYDDSMPEPKNLKKMEEIARILSSGIKFVRVDLYNIDGKIYFGEMTFTPIGGYFKFNPKKWDLIFGDLLELDA